MVFTLLSNFTTRFANSTLGNSNDKNSWQALTVSILFVLKSFMKNRFTTKSSEAICDLLRAQASGPYKSTGTHLL